jgi:ankyrin repeat protein
MTFKFIPFSTLIVSLALSSCGKKAGISENETRENSIAPTVAEVYFNALKEIKRAVNENDLAALKKTISENPGVDLNQTLNENGETFLTLAIKKDFRNIRNFLIDKGVRLEKANVNKETPLIAAVASGGVNSVKVLLDLKVDLEKKDINGDTALHISLKKSNDEIALLLLKQGANVYTVDKKERNSFRLAEEYNVQGARELIKSIMDMEFGAPDISGFRTILLQSDHKRLQGVLLRYPKIATDKAYESINPLALLVEAKDETNAMRSAEILINNDANVDGPEDAEQSPLLKATVSLKKSFANLYLTSKANTEKLDKDGKSPLIHAIELNNPEMVDLLLSYSAVENYEFRKEGKRLTFNSCKIAKNIGKNLKSADDEKKNKHIRNSLDCGLLAWLF